MMDLQHMINSSMSLRLVSALAQRLSPSVGYRIADFLAGQIARRRESKIVRAVRLNQWVVHGGVLRGTNLDWVVRQTFRDWARCIFDLYHYIDDPAATRQLVVLEPSFQRLARRPEFERRGDRRGLLIAGLHLSNFDLILQWLCKEGLKPLALSIPDPQGGRRMEYEMRKRTGMNVVPASVGAFRQAIRHLRQGGMVVTGIDRPIPNPEACPRFFGRPAALPMHHIFLATKARVPVILAVAHLQQDEKYHVFASDLIEMDTHPDPKASMLRNAEKVLAAAEDFIRKCPHQWSVPLPVWPQVMHLVPN
jgi:KDO2-lipid IV(A) lauroyltransferase